MVEGDWLKEEGKFGHPGGRKVQRAAIGGPSRECNRLLMEGVYTNNPGSMRPCQFLRSINEKMKGSHEGSRVVGSLWLRSKPLRP